MPFIDPFTLDPSGPFDALVNYYLATWARLIYYDRADLNFRMLQLAGAGLGDLERFEERDSGQGDVFPRIDICHLPGGDLVHIRGTTTNGQLILNIAGTGTVPIPPVWSGRVSAYSGLRALNTWEIIQGSLGPTWMTMGHSLGGSLAGLISQFGAEKVWTIGQPREGDREYADSRTNGQKLRIYNAEDLVPKLPAASGIDLNFLGGLFPTAGGPSVIDNYWHWGTPRIFTSSGTGRPERQDRGQVHDVISQFTSLLLGNGWVIWHAPERYAFRIRRRLPYAFPAAKIAPTLAGLAELDEINDAINQGPYANVYGSPAVWTITQNVGFREGDPNNPADAVGDWAEIGDEDERRVIRFTCPGE